LIQVKVEWGQAAERTGSYYAERCSLSLTSTLHVTVSESTWKRLECSFPLHVRM